jgi:nicotinate phosphoribosyltransferase
MERIGTNGGTVTPSELAKRLDPDTFRLPEEAMRSGYYSDAYFNFTKELLEADHHPRVLMQVFQKKDSVLGGIDEAIAILKAGAGHFTRDTHGSARAGTLDVHALHEGDPIEPWEPVMTIEGDYAQFAHLETVYLG